MDSRVNIQKTRENYESLLDQFITSELINANPHTLSEQELLEMMDRRAQYSGGASWFERTFLFYSRCILESIIPHNGGAYPWTQLLFEPFKTIGVVTMNRFTYSCPVVFPNSGWQIDRNQYKANEILGAKESYQTLNDFQSHLGQSYIRCYSFPTHNSFNLGSTFACIRFAVMDYKREALLLTQGYSINYLLNHPAECFPGLIMDGTKVRLMNREINEEVFSPVFEKRRDELIDIKGRIELHMAEFDLTPEIL